MTFYELFVRRGRALLVLGLLLALCQGVQAQPAELELGWRKTFVGTVTFLGEGKLELELPDARRLAFDIVAETEAIPSEMAVRVGSPVEVLATQSRLLRVKVIPFSEWLEAPRFRPSERDL